jgi:hypothetical protein
MAKYKVIVIAHQLKNNKIAKSKDIVDESQLNGNAAELVKAGFIVPVKEDKKDIDADLLAKKEAKLAAKKEAKELAKKEVKK